MPICIEKMKINNKDYYRIIELDNEISTCEFIFYRSRYKRFTTNMLFISNYYKNCDDVCNRVLHDNDKSQRKIRNIYKTKQLKSGKYIITLKGNENKVLSKSGSFVALNNKNKIVGKSTREVVGKLKKLIPNAGCTIS